MHALDRVDLRGKISVRDLEGRKPTFITAREKHPKLEAVLEDNIRLIFWADKKLRKWLDPNFHWPRYYLCSFAIDALNYCLYSYDPEKGKLSTYFYRTCIQHVHREFLRFESEYWQKRIYLNTADPKDQQETKVNYAYHELDFVLYRVPEADLDWAQEILSFFHSREEAWDFLTKQVSLRWKNILERRFRFGHTLDEISIDEKITRQRVQQIQMAALRKIRENLFEAEKLMDHVRELNIKLPQFSVADTKGIRIRHN